MSRVTLLIESSSLQYLLLESAVMAMAFPNGIACCGIRVPGGIPRAVLVRGGVFVLALAILGVSVAYEVNCSKGLQTLKALVPYPFPDVIESLYTKETRQVYPMQIFIRYICEYVLAQAHF